MAALTDAPEAFESSYAKEVSWSELAWRARLDASNRLASVALAGEVAAGIVAAVIHAEDADLADLGSMWVRPQFRGRGIADALLEDAVAWAREQGASTVHLWVVADNWGVRRLYERHGFSLSGVSVTAAEGSTGSAEVAMQRIL